MQLFVYGTLILLSLMASGEIVKIVDNRHDLHPESINDNRD